MFPLLIVIFLLGAGGLMGGMKAPSSGSYPFPAVSACQPHLEYNKQIKVDVNPDKEKFSDGRDLYLPKETKLWVLVKRNAPIPAWKVWGGAEKKRNGETLGEMEEIGITTIVDSENPDNPLNQNSDAFGKRVFIGLGHCDGDPGGTCLDPLTQDTLFLAEKEGSSPPNIIKDKNDPNYWWEFNVYYDLAKLPHSPTNEDLPCWMKMECEVETVMGDCRKWMVKTNCGQNPGSPPPAGCELGDWAKANTSFFAKILTRFKAFSQEFPPPSFIRKDEIDFTKPEKKDEVKDVYWSETKTDKDPVEIGAELIGGYPKADPVFDVYYFSDSETLILSSSSSSSPLFYTYVPLISIARPGAKTLQLGTFSPIKAFHYEWFTPSCKPALYLYPEKPTRLQVVLKPAGKLTVTDPVYDSERGWEVLAFPDGTLTLITNYSITNYSFPYLFYEAEIEKVKTPQKGWLVKKEQLKSLFDIILPRLGLNQNEAQEFKEYWVKALNDAPYYFVGLIDRDELERIEPIEFSQDPDTFIRVRLFFEPLEKPMTVDSPTLPSTPSRQGFVAVDWGGILSSGTCQAGDALNVISR